MDDERFVAVYELVQEPMWQCNGMGLSVAIIVASGYESAPTFYFHFSLDFEAVHQPPTAPTAHAAILAAR